MSVDAMPFCPRLKAGGSRLDVRPTVAMLIDDNNDTTSWSEVDHHRKRDAIVSVLRPGLVARVDFERGAWIHEYTSPAHAADALLDAELRRGADVLIASPASPSLRAIHARAPNVRIAMRTT